MYFHFYETSSKKKNNIHIFLGENDKVVSKVYILDFFDTILNKKLLIAELDKILAYSEMYKLNYISKDLWIRYQLVNEIKIPAISKKNSKTIISHTDKGSGAEIKTNRTNKEHDIYFTDNKIALKQIGNRSLFDSIATNGNTSYIANVSKEAYFNNYTELTYIFLECIFNSINTYYVRKCKYCGLYFIANRSNKEHCERTSLVKEKHITCAKIISTIEKTYEYKTFINEDRKFRDSLESNKKLPYTYLPTYLNEKEKLRNECFKTRNLSILKDFVSDYKTNNPIQYF